MSETDKTATAIAMANGRTIREVMEDEYRRGYFAGLNARQAADYAYALELQKAAEAALEYYENGQIGTRYAEGEKAVLEALRAALAENPDASRSQLRRIAAQKDEPAPEFPGSAVTVLQQPNDRSSDAP